MAAEQQPDPILPNYNPSSWDVPTLSPEERAILDTEYITFPIAQNQDITFPISPVAPTLPNGTATTQVATAGFVQNAITALKGAINVWSSLNTFNGGLSATSITRTGTLTITGTPLALTNTRLDTPMTPNYTYPIASGKIGEVISSQLATFTVTTAGTIYDLTTISLDQGVWVLTGDTGGPAVSTYVRIGFGTTSLTITRGGANMTQNNSNPSLCNTSATISLTSTTTIYFVGTFGTAQTLTNVLLQACRIA
jgi:hypothetical protein